MAQTKTNNTPPHTDTHLQPPTRYCWKPVVVVTACKGRCRQEQNTRECARETNNSFGQQQKITQRCTSRDEMHYCTHVETLHVCVYDEDGLEGFSDSFFLLFCFPPSCHPWILAHHIYTSEYRANSNSQKKRSRKKNKSSHPPHTIQKLWLHDENMRMEQCRLASGTKYQQNKTETKTWKIVEKPKWLHRWNSSLSSSTPHCPIAHLNPLQRRRSTNTDILYYIMHHTDATVWWNARLIPSFSLPNFVVVVFFSLLVYTWPDNPLTMYAMIHSTYYYCTVHAMVSHSATPHT